MSHAHAVLEKTDPQSGATAPVAPTEVRLLFSEPLEPAFSTVDVTDAQGRRVAAGKARVDEFNTAVLRIPLARLGPGTYMVAWRVVSVDTHASEGRFLFHVAP